MLISKRGGRKQPKFFVDLPNENSLGSLQISKCLKKPQNLRTYCVNGLLSQRAPSVSERHHQKGIFQRVGDCVEEWRRTKAHGGEGKVVGWGATL